MNEKPWIFRCAKCSLTVEMPFGTLPIIDPNVPHPKDGYLLSTDQMAEPASWCHGAEFIKEK